MTDWANLILFLTASLTLAATPGPDNIYVLTRGVAQGRTAALVSAAGVCSGLVVHTTFAAVGLSALLARSAVAFSAVKYAGAAYLIYLGIKTLLDKDGVALPGGAAALRLRKVFLQGVASNVLNPKVALFFVAFLPQFVSADAGAAAPQFLALGALFAALGFGVMSLIAFFSGTLGDWLGSRPRFSDALRWLTGSVLVGLGLRLAFSDRR